MSATPSNGEALLLNWHHAIRICHKAHIKAAAYMQKKGRAFGIPVVFLSTAAGTSVFATLESSPSLGVKVAIGLVSLLAAVLAALQTYLGYSELAAQHRSAAQRYGALRRDIEQTLATGGASAAVPPAYLEDVRSRWDSIDEGSPNLSQRLYGRIEKDVKSRTTV